MHFSRRGILVGQWRRGRSFRKLNRHRERDDPWHCPQSTVLVVTLPSLWDSGTHWQRRSRLRASIPDTFPLFPLSFLHILHPLVLLLPLVLLSLHNFWPLFWEQAGQKVRGCSSQQHCCHGFRVWKKKKSGALSREEQTRAALCCCCRAERGGRGDVETGGAAVSGVLCCPSTGCVTLFTPAGLLLHRCQEIISGS